MRSSAPIVSPSSTLALSGLSASDFRLRPHDARIAVQQAGERIAGAQRLHLVAVAHLGEMRGELRLHRLELRAGRKRAEQRAHRHGQRAVPVFVEALRQVARDRPHREHVVVAELQLVARIEILVADVAPADDRDARCRRRRACCASGNSGGWPSAPNSA